MRQMLVKLASLMLQIDIWLRFVRNATSQIQFMIRKKNFGKVFLAVLLLVGININRLKASQPAQWTSMGAGGGGALFAPSFNPFSPGELWMTCDMSEVFRS